MNDIGLDCQIVPKGQLEPGLSDFNKKAENNFNRDKIPTVTSVSSVGIFIKNVYLFLQ